MAQPQARNSGYSSIQSLKDDDAIFKAFDGYPWRKDKNFMSGLHAILGEPGQTPRGSLVDMATHARIFYYNKKIGVTLDYTRYQQWLDNHPDHSSPDVLPDAYCAPGNPVTAAADPYPLDWQQAAPKADLYVDRNAADQGEPDDQPAYPMGFAEMLKLIQEGKPVPGIRQIPNTIIRDPSVKPVGARAAPKKPWERSDATSATALPNVAQTLDSEFPPVDEMPHAGTA